MALLSQQTGSPECGMTAEGQLLLFQLAVFAAEVHGTFEDHVSQPGARGCVTLCLLLYLQETYRWWCCVTWTA
jgi:hypothetical protein